MAVNLTNLNGNTNYNQQITHSDVTGQTGTAGVGGNLGSTGSVSAGNTISAGNLMLQNMLAGETFTGLVLHVKDNQVSMALSNGASLTATLSDNVHIQSGQNITFLVEENQDHHITLKPVAANEQQALMINRALEGAGLSMTSDNISMVKELISLNMPINAETINQLLQKSMAFPETDYHTLANMLRLEIPINADNIMQFQAYSHFENTLSNQLEHMEEGFLQMLLSGEASGEMTGEAGLGTESGNGVGAALINTLYDGNGQTIQSMALHTLLSETEISQLSKELQGLADAIKENPSMEGQQATIEQALSQLKEGSLTVKDFLTTLFQMNQGALGDSPALKHLLTDDTLKSALHQMMNETMKLTPEDVRNAEAIPTYYERIRKNLEKASNLLEKNGGNPEVQKDLNQVKSNIDFMNDLNKNMTFFQMPIKFSESEGNGELYVFTNKKALKHHTDNVSALLHLDMEHLGPMDVYVKLANQNVSTNFCLESEEMLDFVYAHIDTLNERLEALGYSTHFEMNVTAKEEAFDFVEDFIEGDIPKMAMEQYIFDSKV